MADLRMQMAIKIVDPTTNSLEAGVATLADALANPTAVSAGAFLMGYNGSTWDRVYAVADGGTVAGGTKGFLALGTDGSNYQVLSTNATGHVNIADGGNSITVDGTVAVSGTVTVDSELATAAALADGAANPTTATVGSATLVWNGSTWDRAKQVVAAQDTTGTGIQAVGMLAQFDDAATATVTENQFAPPRLSTRRALLVEGVASGTNINVNLAASAATVTVDSELPTAAALADNAANPTTPTVGAALLGFDGTTWDRIYTVADGDAVAAGTKGFLALGTDGSNYQVLSTNASGHVSINDGGNSITIDGSVSISGTPAVDTELPAAAALADATANPTVPGVGGFLMGYNGSTWDRVRTANTGRLQVDVITGGSTDAPTSPVSATVTSAALAAGSSANLDSADLATKYLWQCDITASVAFKAIVSTLTNGVATAVSTLFGQPGTVVQWKPPHRNWVVSGSSAGADGFRVAMTNLDTSEAADVYATFHYANN